MARLFYRVYGFIGNLFCTIDVYVRDKLVLNWPHFLDDMEKEIHLFVIQ